MQAFDLLAEIVRELEVDFDRQYLEAWQLQLLATLGVKPANYRAGAPLPRRRCLTGVDSSP